MRTIVQNVFLIAILFFPLKQFAQCSTDLGTDTIVCGSSVQLDAGAGGVSYLWNTGATSQQITVSMNGNYFVTVTDSFSCISSDTVNVSFTPPSVAGIISLAGGDTILCGNENTIFYSIGHTGYVLWWVMDTINWVWAPFGSGDTLDYGPSPNNMSGSYIIMATATNGNCPADTANILNVALHTSPEVNLGPDDTLCGFNTYLYSGYPGEQNMWSNGDTTDYTIATASGIYAVTVTNQNGCWDSDTLVVDVFSYPPVSYSCPVDTMCVDDTPLLLIPGTPAGGAFVGAYISNGYLDPVMSGSHLVVYSWTDTITGCVGAAGDYVWVDPCVGTSEFEDTELSVYPNPATDQVTIVLSIGEHTIEILDMQGRIIRTLSNAYCEKEIVTDITDLDDGAYIIRVSGANSIHYTHFIKQSAH